jgi:hypothetical protein
MDTSNVTAMLHFETTHSFIFPLVPFFPFFSQPVRSQENQVLTQLMGVDWKR